MIKCISKTIGLAGIVLAAQLANAGVMSVFDSSWTQMSATSEDILGSVNQVHPGWGGQKFDAEYLFYKINGTVLSLGLQTGYDISTVTGIQNYGGKDYYAGDLALSFNGLGGKSVGNTDFHTTFEYAVDFGFTTKNYAGNTFIEADSYVDGIDVAGLYKNVTWNNDIHFDDESNPYAMDAGDLVMALTSQASSETFNESGYSNTSYSRVVSFDIAGLGLGSQFDLDAHWTMSCGNDAVDGNAVVDVPEPSSIVLLGLGLIGLGILRRRS